jgi:hypothetical protein
VRFALSPTDPVRPAPVPVRGLGCEVGVSPRSVPEGTLRQLRARSAAGVVDGNYSRLVRVKPRMGKPWQAARAVLGAIGLLFLTACGQHYVAASEATRATPDASHPTVRPTPHPVESHSTKTVRRTSGPPARTCRSSDLTAQLRRPGEGATGHFWTPLDLRNIGRTRCILSGYPIQVTVTEPGRPPITARLGSLFVYQLHPSRAMNPGGITTLVIQSDTYCDARPSGGPRGPLYRHVSVKLADGVLNASTPRARPLDLGCGALVSRFGTWQRPHAHRL